MIEDQYKYINILIYSILLNKACITFKYGDVFKMKKNYNV